MTFLERINRVPPAKCRLLARNKRTGGLSRMLTNAEIAKASGLSKGMVAKLSRMTSWERVTAATINAFVQACGVDLYAPSKRRDDRIIKGGKFVMFENSAPAQRRMVARMLNTFRGDQQAQPA